MPLPPDSPLISYHYDALDRCVTCVPHGELPLIRFYQRERLATEIQGAVQRQIVQAPNVLLAERYKADIERTLLLMTDGQGSVLRTSDEKSAYTPYGHRTVEGVSPNLLGFNGKRSEPLTGDYLLGNGHRAFMPGLMRFNRPDRLSPFGEGGLNCYSYCAGDPINRTDPTGKSWYGWAWFANAALGFVTDYMVRFTPKALVSGLRGTTFGNVTKSMAAVSGFGATALYLVMNRVEAAHPESDVNDPLFYAFLTTSTFSGVMGAGFTLHKLARRVPKSRPPRHVRSPSLPNIRPPAAPVTRAFSSVRQSRTPLNPSLQQPHISREFGSHVPISVTNTNLERFNLKNRFELGEFRGREQQNSILIRQTP